MPHSQMMRRVTVGTGGWGTNHVSILDRRTKRSRIRGKGDVAVLSAINNLRRNYPAFAAASKLGCIRTCEDVKAFRRAYDAYSRKHPDFDANQSLGAME